MAFREDLQASLTGAACGLIADPDNDWFGGLIRRVPGAGEDIADVRERATRAARGALGCDDGFSGSPVGFDRSWPNNGAGTVAGQCPAGYRITWVWDRYFNGQLAVEGDSAGAGFIVQGPINDISLAPSGAFPVAQTATQSDLVLFANGSGGRVTYRNLRDIKTELASGAPDNCGEDLPEPGRPGPININLPGLEDDPPEVIFGPPILLPDGDLLSPFCVNIVGVQICGELNLLGGPINIGIGPGVGGGGGGCCDRIPGTDRPLPEDEEPPPEEDPEVPIIGVVVDATSDGSVMRATEIGQTDNPNVFEPRIGHVAFRIKIGEGFRWTNPLDVKGLRVVIPCPIENGAVDVKGTPDQGFTWNLTPVFATVPEQP